MTKRKIEIKGLYRRHFINKPRHHSTGFTLLEIEDIHEGDRYAHGGYITIGDCSRQITLSFDAEDAASRNNSRHKIDTLIKDLMDFREIMEEHLIYGQEADKKRIAEEKKKKKEENG